jgi:hypothetical protein
MKSEIDLNVRIGKGGEMGTEGKGIEDRLEENRLGIGRREEYNIRYNNICMCIIIYNIV